MPLNTRYHSGLVVLSPPHAREYNVLRGGRTKGIRTRRRPFCSQAAQVNDMRKKTSDHANPTSPALDSDMIPRGETIGSSREINDAFLIISMLFKTKMVLPDKEPPRMEQAAEKHRLIYPF